MHALPPLSFGSPHRGLPLPERLRAHMQALLGHDFTDVRLHPGQPVAGVAAFNHGSDIYLAASTFDPDNPATQHLLAHELTHVVQQRLGMLDAQPRGSAPQWLDDPVLEAHAERIAAQAGLPACWPHRAPAHDPARASYRWDVLQATLHFREADGRLREMTDAEQAWKEITQNVQGGFHHFFVHLKREILPILKEWISAQGGTDRAAWRIRREMGQQRHILVFGDHTNMARAVMGEFLAREALDGTETRLARATVQSRYIGAHLAALIEKLRMKLAAPGAAPVLTALLTDATPALAKLPYQPLYKRPGASIPKVLKAPDAYYFEDRVVTLHDVCDYLKKYAAALVEVPPEMSQGTWFRINDLGKPEYVRRPIAGTADFRYKTASPDEGPYTLKENSGYVMAARVQGMPIWAGPSFTTGRMMRMAQWAGASPQEHEALAWAIFAFWNQCYPTSTTWVHRFHEVMDMAANWGVPFEPFTYPSTIPPGHRS